MSQLPGCAAFAECLGDPFQLEADGASWKVELIEAVQRDALAAGGTPQENPRIPFSVVFRGPREPVLPQCVYRLTHERLGRMELFLVPIGPDSSGMQYEAVFS